MKAALYIRVSTEEQAKEGFSIEAQKNKLIQYCQLHDYEIAGIYIDDGYSAKDLNRPEAQRLIEDIKAGGKGIEMVVVYKLDRLIRNLRLLLEMLDLFAKRDIAFTSLTENLDTSTASGRMMVHMIGVLAEWERETISERVADVLEQKAIQQRKYWCRWIPLGYDYIDGRYTPNELEAPIIKKAFELYLQGKGYYQIAKKFNSLGYRTKNGVRFQTTTIIRLLSNEIYRGYFVYGDQSKMKNIKPTLVKAINIEPIIDNETFLRVKKIREAHATRFCKKYARDIFVFAAKIQCSCGRTMFTHIGFFNRKNGIRKYYYRYICRNRGLGWCMQSLIRVENMEKMFIDFLSSFVKNDLEIDLQKNKAKIEELENEKKVLSRNLERELDRKKRLQYLLVDNQIDNKSYTLLLSEMDLIIAQINENIKKTDRQIADLEKIFSAKEEQKIAMNILNEWNSLTLQRKKEFVTLFIKKIYIQDNKIERIEFIL